MPDDVDLAGRVRDTLKGAAGLTERKMFGGITFMLHGNMCCGVINDDLVVRLGADGADEALSQPFARPMDFTGRVMNGYIYIALAGTIDAAALGGWLRRAAVFAESLPPKPTSAARHAPPATR